MKTMFIGVIIVAIIALIALVAVVMINQQSQINDLERQNMLESAVAYCSQSMGFPINEDKLAESQNCLEDAFATYGTAEQYQRFTENLDLLEIYDQSIQLAEQTQQLPTSFSEAGEFLDVYREQLRDTCEQIHGINTQDYLDCFNPNLENLQQDYSQMELTEYDQKLTDNQYIELFWDLDECVVNFNEKYGFVTCIDRLKEDVASMCEKYSDNCFTETNQELMDWLEVRYPDGVN